ncbi:MAG: hypothetical protein ABL982_14065 [Vicinamibacterales bacterium]
MTVEQRRRTVRLATALGCVAMSLACAAATNGADPSLRGATAIDRQIQGSGATAPRLDHLIPARDSQGSLPTRFEWTPVPGAETYSIGVWNEVDMLIWRKDQIPTNSYVPTDLRLEPGTYFWTISAIRGGEEMTASGLSAFVIRPPNPQQ